MKQKEKLEKLKSMKRKKIDSDIYEKKIRNKETNIISFIFVGLFMILTGYLIYFNAFIGPEVINNAYNKRIDNLSTKVVRGEILSADGNVLASTTTDADGNENRVYPYGSVFSHVVGLESHGKSGIEKLSNFFLLSSKSNVIEEIANDVSSTKAVGDNVVTTLNVTLQQAASKALGDNKGAVVVMEPSTGKILAMVSKPDYDPNEADAMMNEWITYDSADSVLLNRATQGLYPPGSTFKILTTIEYLRENPNYNNFSYNCSGSTTTKGASTIHCFNETAHGSEDLNRAFANSCNSAFATIGQTLNVQKYRSLCESFSFNNDLPIGIEYNKSSFQLDTNSNVSEIMETSIGQGKTLITPMLNLMIVATIANKGVMMQPYLVDKVVNSDNQIVQQYDPIEYKKLMTEQEAQILTGYMRSVVTIGTGSSFKNASYKMVGKTGSAQYDSSENYHSWFVGFAPEENPEIAISVILEGGYTNVASAQAVAKKIVDAYFNK